MKKELLNDLVVAMKSRDKDTLSVLRMVKGSIQMEELSLKKELDDSEVITIIGKQIKTRKESITEFEKGNRNDLVEQTKKEIEILNKYMPEQLSEEKIITEVDNAIKELNLTSIKDMGKIMSYLTPILKGKADMGMVSKIIKEKLN